MITFKIFGIGLSRTGTVSLTVALKILGYNIIHSPRSGMLPGMLQMINNYDGATDSQVAYAFKELDKIYPNSKFILTTRPLESWLQSYQTLLSYFRVEGEGMKEMYLAFYGTVVFNKDLFIKTYNKHHNEVMEYFKNRNDLLIMDFTKGDGWNKLCPFIGSRIPYYPFPYTNTSTEYKKNLQPLLR